MNASHRATLVTAPSFATLESALLNAIVDDEDGRRRAVGILPTPYVARRLHRLLDERGRHRRHPLLLTLRELVRRLAGADSTPPVPGAALAVLRALTNDVMLAGPLRAVAAQPGGQGALFAAFDALRAAGYVRPGLFRDAVAAHPAPSPLLRHLAALYERFEQETAALSITGSIRMRAALDAAGSLSVLFRTDRLFIHGFLAFTPYEQTLIASLARSTDLTVYLPFASAGHAGAAARPFAALGPVRDWLLALGCVEMHLPDDEGTTALDHLRRHWPAVSLPAIGAEPDASASALQPSVIVLSAPNIVREVREAARGILRAARDGVPYDEMAVLYSRPETYAPLLAETLTAVNVPVFLEGGRPLVTLPAGRALRQLLLLIHGPARRSAVMEFITSAPLRLPAGAVPARWDRLARVAGVIRGPDQWQSRLRHLVARRTGDAQHAEGPRRDALLDDAAEAGRLLEYAAHLFHRLAAIPHDGGWPEFTTHLRTLAVELLDDPDLPDILTEIDGLTGLNAVEPRISFETFREAALARLREQRVRPNPPAPFPAKEGGEHSAAVDQSSPLPALGEGAGVRAVFLSDISAAQALRFRRVWVLGITDGDFPARPQRDPLLPDDDRDKLGLEPQVPCLPGTSAMQAAREAARFKLLLGAASEQLTLSFPRAEPGGARPYQPSYFLLKVGDTLLGRRLRFDEVDTIPGFRRISAARFAPDDPDDALDETERNLAWMERGGPLSRAAGEGLGEGAADDFANRINALAERRRSRRFTPLDGVFLDPEARARAAARADPTRHPLSPTALETYATCPQRYFLQRVLGLEREDEPDALERLAARDKGGLMHTVLETFYHDLRDAGELPLRPERLDVYRDRLLAALAERCRDEERGGRVGHALLWAVDQAEMADDLLETLDEDVKRAADGFVPAEFERPFGMMGEPAAELALADGRIVRFRGLIDRVDRHEDGRLRVIDYKTGRAGPTTPNRFRGGRAMQAPVYLLAARRAFNVDTALLEAELYYCSRRGNFRRARFDGGALAARGDDLQHIIEAAADGITAGRFFPHPYTKSEQHCRVCDFRLVCDARVDRLWTQKQGDPAAAAFIALTEIE
jgi:ATP-dependent helicase/nuclease subunit B